MFMLGDFIRVLRAADVRVSTAESLDAARAVERVGVFSRTVLHDSLAQCLAKSIEDKARFDSCFDAYFAQSAFTSATELESEVEIGSEAESEGEAGEDHFPSLAQMLIDGDRSALQARLAAAGRLSGLSDARFFTQQGLFTRRVLEAMGIGDIEIAQRLARQAGDDARVDVLDTARAKLVREVADYVRGQIALRTQNAGRLIREASLSRIQLTNLDNSDLALLTDLTRRLARRLANKHNLRRRRAHRGQLDVRRTLRRNQGHDGILFDLRWRRRPIRRARLIAMCDVSGSVAAISRFFLTFLYSLGEVMPKTRSFVFSNRCGEVTDLFAQSEIELALVEALRQYGGGSSDYGQSFMDLSALADDFVDHRTSLIILGDARSNYGDPGHLILRDFYMRAKRVIWLNPEPRSSWDSGDSEMRRLGVYSNRVETCNSIYQLERVVADILRYAI